MSAYQRFLDTTIPVWEVRDPPLPLAVGLCENDYAWMDRIRIAAAFEFEEIVTDAAWCGSICVQAAREALKVGLTPDNRQFHDLTLMLNGPTAPLSENCVAATVVPHGVGRIIGMTQRQPGRIVCDGINLLRELTRDLTDNRHLVIANLHEETGRAPIINGNEVYPISTKLIRDYREAARRASHLGTT